MHAPRHNGPPPVDLRVRRRPAQSESESREKQHHTAEIAIEVLADVDVATFWRSFRSQPKKLTLATMARYLVASSPVIGSPRSPSSTPEALRGPLLLSTPPRHAPVSPILARRWVSSPAHNLVLLPARIANQMQLFDRLVCVSLVALILPRYGEPVLRFHTRMATAASGPVTTTLTVATTQSAIALKCMVFRRTRICRHASRRIRATSHRRSGTTTPCR